MNLPYFQKITELAQPLSSQALRPQPAPITPESFEQVTEIEISGESVPSFQQERERTLQTTSLETSSPSTVTFLESAAPVAPIRSSVELAKETAKESTAIFSPEPILQSTSITSKANEELETAIFKPSASAETPMETWRAPVLEVTAPLSSTVEEFFKQTFIENASMPSPNSAAEKYLPPQSLELMKPNQEMQHLHQETHLHFSVEQRQFLQQYIQTLIEEKTQAVVAEKKEPEFFRIEKAPASQSPWRGWSASYGFPNISRMRIR